MNINTPLVSLIDKKLYDINKKLIIDICNELNNSDKIDYFINKYLNKKTKNSNKLLNISNIKRNKSSYLFFTEEIRPKLRSKFPNDTMGQISKRLGKLWSDLTAKDKSKYEKKALADKERYLSQINKKVQDSMGSDDELLAEEEVTNSNHDSNHNASNLSDDDSEHDNDNSDDNSDDDSEHGNNNNDNSDDDSDHDNSDDDSDHNNSDHDSSDVIDDSDNNSDNNSSEILSEDSSNIITNCASDKSSS